MKFVIFLFFGFFLIKFISLSVEYLLRSSVFSLFAFDYLILLKNCNGIEFLSLKLNAVIDVLILSYFPSNFGIRMYSNVFLLL